MDTKTLISFQAYLAVTETTALVVSRLEVVHLEAILLDATHSEAMHLEIDMFIVLFSTQKERNVRIFFFTFLSFLLTYSQADQVFESI